jgi:L-ornithine N5-monooxygenase
VNEIFNPSRVTPFYSGSRQWREQTNRENRCTNYSVVRLELIERLYEALYLQRMKYGNNEGAWPRRITTNATIRGMTVTEGRIRLIVERDGHAADARGAKIASYEEVQGYDAVVLGTGYDRDAFQHLLSGLIPLKPRSAAGKLIEGKSAEWEVRRDYSLIFADGAIEKGCGVWLQGCCEDSHGVSLKSDF